MAEYSAKADATHSGFTFGSAVNLRARRSAHNFELKDSLAPSHSASLLPSSEKANLSSFALGYSGSFGTVPKNSSFIAESTQLRSTGSDVEEVDEFGSLSIEHESTRFDTDCMPFFLSEAHQMFRKRAGHTEKQLSVGIR